MNDEPGRIDDDEPWGATGTIVANDRGWFAHAAIVPEWNCQTLARLGFAKALRRVLLSALKHGLYHGEAEASPFESVDQLLQGREPRGNLGTSVESSR